MGAYSSANLKHGPGKTKFLLLKKSNNLFFIWIGLIIDKRGNVIDSTDNINTQQLSKSLNLSGRVVRYPSCGAKTQFANPRFLR